MGEAKSTPTTPKVPYANKANAWSKFASTETEHRCRCSKEVLYLNLVLCSHSTFRRRLLIVEEYGRENMCREYRLHHVVKKTKYPENASSRVLMNMSKKFQEGKMCP